MTPATSQLPTIDARYVESFMLPIPKKMRKLVDFTNLVTLAQTARDLSAEFARTGELSVDQRDKFLDDVALALWTTREPLMKLGDIDPEVIAPTSQASRDGREARRIAAARTREIAHNAVLWIMRGISQVVFAAGVDDRVSRRLSLVMGAYATELLRPGNNASRQRRSDLERAVTLFLLISAEPLGVPPPKTCQQYLGRLRKSRAFVARDAKAP